MKKLFFTALAVSILLGCTPKVNDLATSLPINATIDLVHIVDDKVKVEINPGRLTSETVTFNIPKTVPGTYSDDNYGQYIEGLIAYDYKDNSLAVTKLDENSWKIDNATNLDKIIYYVNDTFDSEREKEVAVFSPAGTNIDSGKNFFLNLHMFVGYFDVLKQQPYQLSFIHPENMKASTSLDKTETNLENNNTDSFYANRYFDVTDNPIMYSELNSETFKVNNIEVSLSVYSPNKVYSASDIKEDMERMMKAQKTFLGEVNSTKKYHILLYLSTMTETDAGGFGALEHHTSTTVVLPEAMPKERLVSSMIDIVSHEFFHIVTPLSVHSEEVQYFDYNNPKMSKHLWMYEGITEYFANLFQINQGLINENEFYERLMEKINSSKSYDDEMSFTVMSENILEEPYKSNYINVYSKGALIGMCIDLIIRKQSNGEKGILWLMKQLSNNYGNDKPFKDDHIINEIIDLTYPEVGAFFEKHVIGTTPINYELFFDQLGLKYDSKTIETAYFLDEKTQYIDVNPSKKEVFFRNIELNSFLTNLGVKGGDIIKSLNGTAYNLDNVRDMILLSRSWKPGDHIDLTVSRDNKEVSLSGKVEAPVAKLTIIVEDENATESQKKLRNSWLKG